MSEISQLIANLHNVKLKNVAASRLAELGKAALPSVLAVLNDKSESPDVRRNVAWLIGKMGDQGLPAVENLAKCAADKTNPFRVRQMALYSLGKMGIGALATRPLLDAILKDDADYEIHLSVKTAIRQIAGDVF